MASWSLRKTPALSRSAELPGYVSCFLNPPSYPTPPHSKQHQSTLSPTQLQLVCPNCFVKKSKNRSSYKEKGFYISSISKEGWNAFFNIRINNSRDLSPIKLTRALGISPHSPEEENFLCWHYGCLTDCSGLEQRSPGGLGEPAWGHWPRPRSSWARKHRLLRSCPVQSSSVPLSHPQMLF